MKKLLKYLHHRASERKRRLFAVELHLLANEQAREALATIERYAEGSASNLNLSRADALYGAACGGVGWDFAEYAATNAAAGVGATGPRGKQKEARQKEATVQLVILRDIFGNPFRPVDFNKKWRTSDVMLLAKGIYDERAFDRMPILADALQDAGCDSDDLLNHLRDPHATHVRGCWALDLVLGKE
jgi:hypothetical protein